MSARITFAQNLRRLRQSLAISQEELADMSNLHRTYISSVERGIKNISIDNMEKLSIALNVKLVELLDDNQR